MRMTFNLPENPTNGEVLTALFPNLQTRSIPEYSDFIEFTLDGLVGYTVEKQWWEGPYRNESQMISKWKRTTCLFVPAGGNTMYNYYQYECLNCGKKTSEQFKYCPNCGSRMEDKV